ncbi:PREDICTED: tumor necrosis factor receptor superfamily member 11A-like [Nanorana parkeri]|uniref:tumor necrosis factor receptor superfamily member 11A-like n=1 Tax=Nanorana parkeri TaxID=125878 RepID=UPI0008545E4F|nr:PREDICTED: tumor necrosis factor receptor superfamily member 11A-like [Nanorana parkeri]
MEGFMIRVWTFGALFITLWCFGAETNSNCNTEKHYEHAARCCLKCQPGTYMTKRCSSSADTVCSPCGPNEYMSAWNDDLKCSLHTVCDSGKALQVFNNGNSTYPRECMCTDGYHFNTNQEICMENTKCPFGFGVQIPGQRNKNTVCVPCQERYFSNISSSTEQCQPWANCSALGLQEIVPGTNISDAVCDHLIIENTHARMIILITVLIVFLAVILFVSVFCCMKKYSTLKASMQGWIQEPFDKLCGSEKKAQYREVNTIECGYIIKNATVVKNNHSDHFKEIQTPRGRLVPTEDEYMDHRRSLEPENGNMVAGLESSSDLESGSMGTFHAYSDTSSDRLLSSNEEVIIQPCPECQCDQSAKETPRYRREEHCIPDPVDSSYGQHSSRHEFYIYPEASYHIPEKNTDKEPCSCFTNAHCTRSSSRSSTDNMSFPETPPTPSGNVTGNHNTTVISSAPVMNIKTDMQNKLLMDAICLFLNSGNVTGNHNTTVISSAPVMNIKTDMVVVYYRGSSQDAHIPCESEQNIKRPMQEERQDHCDSFVANTPPYKYDDIPCCSVPDTDCTEADGPLRDSNCSVMSNQDNIMFCQNTDYLPVQEEGKPEFYH